jgi:hypothetical protein
MQSLADPLGVKNFKSGLSTDEYKIYYYNTESTMCRPKNYF